MNLDNCHLLNMPFINRLLLLGHWYHFEHSKEEAIEQNVRNYVSFTYSIDVITNFLNDKYFIYIHLLPLVRVPGVIFDQRGAKRVIYRGKI